ncbi:uracil-DNA glycosylase family protein [Thiocapsa marina]|uniref:Type-4 uracil-DNA glycosylase n=1 Tax=Thiocapsa marina 5811 TaxID=768671 RepID=F9U8E1_9GAMM|nr:uracil-DNA glycosylase family protein [Thiocapsa marina]EGV19553.1 phage SPO1 DNA polymerase-related protein [Thiocapsa marina 5811]
MDERRRLDYLGAMGVDVWVPRLVAAGRIESSDEIAVVEPSRILPPARVSDPADLRPVSPSAQPIPRTPPAHAEAHEVAPNPVVPGPVASGPVGPALPEALSPPDPALMDWDALAAAVSGCRACGLCETRTNTVFGVGDRNADLLIIGEAPGAEEDRAGEPFVGRAGQLLNRMLAAIGLAREQVYIANVLKCRPPGNRDPHPEEARQCEAYLLRQIELLRPRAILCVGRVAAQNILQTDAPLGSLRGRWLTFRTGAIPLRVTYHPAYLLRSPEQKAKAWEDLVEVVRRLRGEGCAVIGKGNDKDQSD